MKNLTYDVKIWTASDMDRTKDFNNIKGHRWQELICVYFN